MTERVSKGCCWALAMVCVAAGCGPEPADDSAAAAGDNLTQPAPERLRAPTSGCIRDLSPGEHQLTCADLEVHVSVPTGCDFGQCGLILDLPAGAMDADALDANTQLRALGGAHEYIVVQPTAPPREDNTNPLWAWAGPLPLWRQSDVPRLQQLVQQTVDAWQVAPGRVHMTGFAEGGTMAWSLFCARPDLFASIAPAAEGAPENCDLSDPALRDAHVPVLFMMGARDADYERALSQRDQLVEHWQLDREQVLQQSDSHLHTRFSNDRGGLLEFLQHDYAMEWWVFGGQCIPGSEDVAAPHFPPHAQGSGTGSSAAYGYGFGCADEVQHVHWGDAVMAFFRATERVAGEP